MTSFAEPEVSDEIVMAVRDELSAGEAYPWDVIAAVEQSLDVEKQEVRDAVRTLKLSNEIVPAEPFVGRIELASESDD